MSNLVQPNPENLELMRQITNEILPPNIDGALFWTRENGFDLQLAAPPEGESLPMPLYILGLCFVRLTTDPNFKQAMLDWANRNQN